MDADTTLRTWVPDGACTLPTAERPWRLAEFDELLASSLDGTHRLAADHLRLDLSGDPTLQERVADLAARETACCSFFDLRVDGSGSRVTLDVRVPSSRTAVLDGLHDRARAVRRSR